MAATALPSWDLLCPGSLAPTQGRSSGFSPAHHEVPHARTSHPRGFLELGFFQCWSLPAGKPLLVLDRSWHLTSFRSQTQKRPLLQSLLLLLQAFWPQDAVGVGEPSALLGPSASPRSLNHGRPLTNRFLTPAGSSQWSPWTKRVLPPLPSPTSRPTS